MQKKLVKRSKKDNLYSSKTRKEVKIRGSKNRGKTTMLKKLVVNSHHLEAEV